MRIHLQLKLPIAQLFKLTQQKQRHQPLRRPKLKLQLLRLLPKPKNLLQQRHQLQPPKQPPQLLQPRKLQLLNQPKQLQSPLNYPKKPPMLVMMT